MELQGTAHRTGCVGGRSGGREWKGSRRGGCAGEESQSSAEQLGEQSMDVGTGDHKQQGCVPVRMAPAAQASGGVPPCEANSQPRCGQVTLQ